MTDFLQLMVAGVALGCLYALVALGFVIVYKATGVINFAQGALLVLGTYLTHSLTYQLGLPFLLAVPAAMGAGAALGLLVERLVLRRMVGQPVFAVIMITLGLAIMADQVVTWVWGYDRLEVGDPWGNRTFELGGVVIAQSDVAKIVVAAALLVAFFVFFTYSRLGIAMRATASDQEAALAHGISVRRIFALSWAIAAAIATAAGVLLASGPRGVDPTLGVVALVAFPAVILGGLDSPPGAVAGGLVVGLVEVMTAGYGPRYLPEWLGTNFHTVMPYLVMVAILMVRPYGLLGTREVRRV